MDCSWSISSCNILDLRFMPVCVETHNACWCLKISKKIVPFRWIISKKDCIISVVDVGEMEVANINSKTTRTVSHEPVNCTAKKRRSKYTTLHQNKTVKHSHTANLHYMPCTYRYWFVLGMIVVSTGNALPIIAIILWCHHVYTWALACPNNDPWQTRRATRPNWVKIDASLARPSNLHSALCVS